MQIPSADFDHYGPYLGDPRDPRSPDRDDICRVCEENEADAEHSKLTICMDCLDAGLDTDYDDPYYGGPG